MRYLAVDYGAKRLGLAVCDADEILVSPLATIERKGARADTASLLEVARAQQIEGIVFGVPRSLQEGQAGSSEAAARAFAQAVREKLASEMPHLAFEEQDERFSTALALRQGRESGLSQKKGRSATGAQSIDARSAAVILQSFLDAKAARRTHAQPPSHEPGEEDFFDTESE